MLVSVNKIPPERVVVLFKNDNPAEKIIAKVVEVDQEDKMVLFRLKDGRMFLADYILEEVVSPNVDYILF